MQGALLVTLLSIPVLAMGGPQTTVFSIHPASFILIAAYVFGLSLVSKARTEPMWTPRLTRETRLDKVRTHRMERSELVLLWAKFILLGIVVGLAGYAVAKSGISIAAKAGISETIVGGIFTAIATSIPELVTSVSAVRQGALTLAVGVIIGGNCFDVLFIAFSDAAYREGSIYGALTSNQLFMISLTILLTGILLLGLLRREKHGIGNIGFESFLIIALYLAAFTFLLF
jgi:cation:H+ antiporter